MDCRLWAQSSFLVLVLLAPAFGAAGQAAARNDAARLGVILHETHWQAGATDTIRTFITPQRVLIEHAGGRTLLDLEADRLVLLDPARRSFRAMPLGQWEATLAAAIGAERPPAAAGGGASSGEHPVMLPFEPVGDSTVVAGYACDRYHYFGQRTLLGLEETVEQQIWVARTLTMPQGAYEAYQRALGSIESIGMGGLLRRPPGVILAVETQTRPASADRRLAPQVERYTVYRVDTMMLLPDSLFAIPDRYTPSDSSSADR